MSLHCRREGRFPAVITAKGEQMVTNTHCGHSAWPLGTSTSLLHDRACLGKTVPKDPTHAEVVSAHPLRAPTWPLPICCCLALPGEEE